MLFRTGRKNKKKIKENSLQRKPFPLPPKGRKEPGGKVSSGAFQRGSLTVESAFVLPLFFLCICTLICFMDIYRLQTQKLSELCSQAREAGMYAYVTGGREDIQLPALYTYEIPVSLVPLPRLVMTNKVKVHPWTGFHQRSQGAEHTEEMVYVTPTGGVYHKRMGCSYLDLSIHIVAGGQVDSLRNQSGGKYHACERCSRGGAAAGTVYITDYGNRYHNQASCSGLKRTARLVKRSELGAMRLCSRCGAG